MIGDHACRLLKSFSFDPKELRGVGIQVQKLESSTASTTVPLGQAVLSFKSKPSTNVGTSMDGQGRIEAPAIPTVTADKDIMMGDLVKQEQQHNTVDLPSFSQVDMTVFDALPREVREELENEYKRRSASPFTAPGPVPVSEPLSRADSVALPSGLNPRRSATPGIFPEKPAGNITNYKRIAQQLAPRTRASASPQKSSLYSWALKPKKNTSVKITDKALLELNLDPGVFFALPIHVQTEQLTMARIIKQKGAIPEPPAERKILKPRKHVLPPDFVPYIAPKPKARHRTPPSLRQQGKEKGTKLYFTETDDIQRIVETWVTAYHKWAPRDKDVDFLCKFLVQSVDRAKATDVGVERAVSVMKWWLVLLRRLFPASEVMDEEDLESSQRDRVGEAWWAAFGKVREEMDKIARKRFGGRLAFK